MVVLKLIALWLFGSCCFVGGCAWTGIMRNQEADEQIREQSR